MRAVLSSSLLERELRGQLHDARADRRGLNLPERGRREIRHRVVELDRVEGIEHFDAQLEVRILREPPNLHAFAHDEIEVLLVRPAHDADATVAEPNRPTIIADDWVWREAGT